MGRRNRLESTSGIYHIMQRGVGKQIIFETDNDYRYYLEKLSEYKTAYNIQLLAYCLMENHVHLLVKSESSEIVSLLMQRIGTSYARYYNAKYLHSGHVFQGRFHAEIVETESYLFACIRYIHNNPVKAGISPRARYQWSSYHEYTSGSGFTDRDYITSIIGNDFVSFSNIKDNIEIMGCDYKALTTKDGIDYLKSKYGFDAGENSVVKSLVKKERNTILKDLKSNGYTAKQIERITGVSRAIIYKA